MSWRVIIRLDSGRKLTLKLVFGHFYQRYVTNTCQCENENELHSRPTRSRALERGKTLLHTSFLIFITRVFEILDKDERARSGVQNAFVVFTHTHRVSKDVVLLGCSVFSIRVVFSTRKRWE